MSLPTPNPIHSTLTIPHADASNETPKHQIHIITNLLDASECSAIIAQHSNLIPSNVLRDTIRDREIFDDEDLRDLLWERIKGFFRSERVVDKDGCEWVAGGLNERFRLCRYLAGGKFPPHRDGTRFASVNEQSFITINIYLNTVSEQHQGATRFLSTLSSPPIVLAKVQPILGTAAIFRDNVWHDGEELLGGEKFLLRTDLMYRRVVDFDFESIYGKLDDEVKGMEMLEIAKRLEDSGQSGEAVGWYRRAFRMWPALERGL